MELIQEILHQTMIEKARLFAIQGKRITVGDCCHKAVAQSIENTVSLVGQKCLT